MQAPAPGQSCDEWQMTRGTHAPAPHWPEQKTAPPTSQQVCPEEQSSGPSHSTVTPEHAADLAWHVDAPAETQHSSDCDVHVVAPQETA